MVPLGRLTVIPMAGAGSRFAQAGYQVPKPFIPVRQRTMVEWVIENLREPGDRFLLIMKRADVPFLAATGLPNRDDVAFAFVDGLTGGCPETLLKVRGWLDDPQCAVTIANCDQFVTYDRRQWRWATAAPCVGAVTMTFESQHPRHSYVRCEGDLVVECAEKRAISDRANVGVFHFRDGHMLVSHLDAMMRGGSRHHGESYLALVLNEFIADGIPVKEFPVYEFRGMGTPEELAENFDQIGADHD